MFQSGQIHFVRFNSDRSYTEITDQLIENPQDGCIWALKALVADFNGDGKPDIFVGCTGPDYLVPVGMAGENSLLLLSQPSGKYRISRPNFGVAGQNANHTYFHSVTAADINGDGAPDIVVADITENDHGRSPVYALVNDGTGNFIKQSVGFDFLFTAGVWFVELLEVNRDGHLSLFIGGAAPRSGAFYKLAGPLNFEQFPFLTLPMHPRYSLDLDIVAKDGSVYVLSVPSDYLGTVVVKYTLASGLESTIWETRPDSGALYIADPETCGGTGGEWVEWFRIFENKIVTDDLCRTPNIPIGN